MTIKKLKGRPNRYSAYDNILKAHAPKSMSKRPVYVNNIGIFRGKTGDRRGIACARNCGIQRLSEHTYPIEATANYYT